MKRCLRIVQIKRIFLNHKLILQNIGLMQEIDSKMIQKQQSGGNSAKKRLMNAQFLCVGRNRAHYFCANPDCSDSALICEFSNCDCHSQIHVQCPLKTINSVLSKIESKTRINAGQQINEKVESFYNEQIQKLSEQREKILFKLRNFGLGPSEIQLATKIQQGLHQQINGNHIYKVGTQSQEQFNYILKQQAAKIWDQKVGQIQKQYDLTNKKVFDQIFNFLAKFRPLNSRILVEQELFIKTAFQKEQLYANHLYSASQNKFSVKKFHEKCDGKRGTLVLFETLTGKIGAAFTRIEWGKYIGSAKDNQAFLFNIQRNKKIPVNYSFYNKAVYHQVNLGPCFGTKDLIIVDKANENLCEIKKTEIYNYQDMKGILSKTKKHKDNFLGNTCTSLFGNQEDQKKELFKEVQAQYLLKQWEIFQIRDSE